jgi:hypothetical protein
MTHFDSGATFGFGEHFFDVASAPRLVYFCAPENRFICN